MIIAKLYSGNGVSYSPEFSEGMREADKVRLIADEGKVITNGIITLTCKDVTPEEVNNWSDCELIEDFPEDITTE